MFQNNHVTESLRILINIFFMLVYFSFASKHTVCSSFFFFLFKENTDLALFFFLKSMNTGLQLRAFCV